MTEAYYHIFFLKGFLSISLSPCQTTYLSIFLFIYLCFIYFWCYQNDCPLVTVIFSFFYEKKRGVFFISVIPTGNKWTSEWFYAQFLSKFCGFSHAFQESSSLFDLIIFLLVISRIDFTSKYPIFSPYFLAKMCVQSKVWITITKRTIFLSLRFFFHNGMLSVLVLKKSYLRYCKTHLYIIQNGLISIYV